VIGHRWKSVILSDAGRDRKGYPGRIRDHNMLAWNTAAGINLRAAPGDSWRIVRLGCPMHRRQAHSASLDDVRASLSRNHNLDTATRPVRARGAEVDYILEH
jgi:hypothetical protein